MKANARAELVTFHIAQHSSLGKQLRKVPLPPFPLAHARGIVSRLFAGSAICLRLGRNVAAQAIPPKKPSSTNPPLAQIFLAVGLVTPG